MTSEYESISVPNFDPSKPAPRLPTTLIAKMVFNGYIRANSTYMAARGGGSPVAQWHQDFDAANILRHDHSPARYSNSLNIEGKDGKPLGEGSAYDVVYRAFAKIGLPQIDPNNPGAAGLLNHWFTLQSQVVELGPFKKTVYVPVEYHGDKCPAIPADQIRVLPPRDSESPTGGTSVPGGVPSPPADDDSVARKVAAILNGKKKEEAVGTLMASELRTVTTLFGLPFLPGFVPDKYPTLQAIIDKGYIVEVDGVLTNTGNAAGA